jgi:hypothetical protein
MSVSILPGEDRCPAGRAERRGDEGIADMGAAIGHPIEIRGLKPPGSAGHETQEIVAVIVAQD